MTRLDLPSVLAVLIPARDIRVSRGRVELFDRVVAGLGGVRPASDGEAVQSVPPTYFFSLELETHGLDYLDELGVPVSAILHGEQGFTFSAPCVPGDVVTVAPRLVDYYEKRAGELGFVVKETTFSTGDRRLATARSTIVIRGAAA